MPDRNLNLLEWYAAHRGEAEVLHDPSALFALGLLDHVGETSRGEFQQDLGVDANELDTTIEKLYDAGFVTTRGTTLGVTPSGKQFLTEIGLRGPLPPPTGSKNTPETPKPPTRLPERPTPKSVAPPAPHTPLWLWGLIGILIIGILLVFGVLIQNPGAQPTPVPVQTATQHSVSPTPLPAQTATGQSVPPTRVPVQTMTRESVPPTRVPVQTVTKQFVPPTQVPVQTATKQFVPPTQVPVQTATKQSVPLTPTPSATTDSTPTTFVVPKAEIVFQVEPRTVAPGACAVVTWQVSNAREVYLDAQPVPEQAGTRVCPKETTTYTLTVLALNGEKLVQTVEVITSQPETNYVWTIVSKDAPFDNLRLQYAIAHAVDEPAIAKAVLKGAGRLYNIDPKLDALEYDPGRAQELSKQARYGGQPVFIVPNPDRTSDALANAIAEYLNAAGFQVRLGKIESRATILVGPEK